MKLFPDQDLIIKEIPVGSFGQMLSADQPDQRLCQSVGHLILRIQYQGHGNGNFLSFSQGSLLLGRRKALLGLIQEVKKGIQVHHSDS